MNWGSKTPEQISKQLCSGYDHTLAVKILKL